MKTIVDICNPDIIEINGEEYQAITHDTDWFDFEKDELRMVITFVKVGVYSLTGTHALTYINESPNDRSRWEFFGFHDLVKFEINKLQINFDPEH